MRIFKSILLASLVVLPLSVSARATDLPPEVTEANTEAMGLYLRGDLGWSFLEWSGGSDDNSFVAGGGVGYRYNDNMRADVTVDWSGEYDVAPGADLSTTTVLGNLYFDWANDSAFTPYVGAGLGYGWADSNLGDDSGLALGLAAGVSIGLTDNVDIDAGYRFRDIMISGPDTQEHQAVVGVRFSF